MAFRRVADGTPGAATIGIPREDGTVEHVASFELEPSEPGVVPERVIDELRRAYREATDYAAAFGDAIKAQAEKHAINAKALRRYIAALEGDKLEEAAKEAADLEKLIG